MFTKIETSNITNTGVTAGTYTNPTIQVNEQGQVTSASSGQLAQGIQGIQGISNQGVQGTQGIEGTSIQGIQGTQGTSGYIGSDGAQGAQGVQGFGYQQNQGIQGTQGTSGSVGNDGAQGIQGVQGIQGFGYQQNQGIQGIQGIQGVQGFGYQQNQGIQGERGIQANQTLDTTSSVTFANLDVTGTITLDLTSEVITTLTGSTGTVTHNASLTSVFYHSSIAANFTANFTNIPTTNNRSISLALILAQDGTPYICNAVEIDGVSQTIKWVSATTPSGTANRTEIISFTLIRVSSAWTVIGSLTTFG